MDNNEGVMNLVPHVNSLEEVNKHLQITGMKTANFTETKS